MAIKWTEVTQKPEFQSLSPLEKHQAQEQYFEEQVVPQINTDNIPVARNQFFTEFPTEFGKAIDEHVKNPNPVLAYNESVDVPKSIWDKTKDVVKDSAKMAFKANPLTEPLVGIAETGAAMLPSMALEGAVGLTGISPQFVGAKMAYDKLQGKNTSPLQASSDIIAKGHELTAPVQEFLQPRTEMGKALTKGLSYPFELAHEMGENAQDYWEAKGHYKTGFVNKMLLEAAPFLIPYTPKILKEAKIRGTSPIKIIEEIKQNPEAITEVIPEPVKIAPEVTEIKPVETPIKEPSVEGFPEGFSVKKVSTGLVGEPFTGYEYEVVMPDGKTFGTASLESAKSFANKFKSIQAETKEIKPALEEVKPVQAETPKDIVQWTLDKGGINYTAERWKGELRDLRDTLNEGKKIGIGNRVIKSQGKYTLDQLALMAKDEGFINEATPQALLDSMRKGKLSVSGIESLPEPSPPKTEIDIAALKKGDKVFIDGEGYQHQGFDEKGNIILKDGLDYALDAFDKFKVDADKKGDPVIQRAAKIKPVQQDMIGVPKDALSHPLISKEMGETLLEKMVEESKTREVQKQDLKKQGKLFNEKPSFIKTQENILGEGVNELIGDVAAPVGLSIKTVTTKTPTNVREIVAFPEEIEKRYQSSKGISPVGLWSNVKDVVQDAWNKSTRVYEHLPNTAEFAPLKKDLLQLKKQKGVASDRTVRAIQGITINLDKAGYVLFSRKVILDDLHATAKKGQDLPFGFTPETLTDSKAKVDSAVAGNKVVSEAIGKRNSFWDAIKKDYSNSMQSIGFDVSDKLTNENYFRHQVIEYANVKGLYGTGQKLKTPSNRGFLRKREGSSLDINSDYLQADHQVMAQMLHDIEVAKTIRNVDQRYNIVDKVKSDAKAKGLENWQDAIPDGYSVWQPKEGHVFYLSDTLPSKIARQLQEGMFKELGISADVLKKSLSVGGLRKEFVLKNEIIKTLDNLSQTSSDSAFLNLDRKLLRGWKIWTLISPRRFLKYNARNLSGDADAVFVGNPSAFKYAPRAYKELYDTVVGKKAMTPEMKDWFERGGMESTLQAQEMGDLNKLPVFKNLYGKKGSLKEIPLKAWKGYWKTARMATDVREANLRYAAYLDYLEQMKSNPEGKPKNFGASIPEEVMALTDIKDRAYWLSNDLLGAYDKVSVAGNKLREYLYPFWSWKEVNFKRYVQFAKNAVNDGNLTETAGRKILGTALKSPYIALRAGKFLFKATALWSMLQVWNNTKFPDEEKDLPENERNRPHIIFGRDKDGNVIYFNRLGALGDFLQWFGLDAAPQTVDKWLKGEKSLKETAIDMAKSPVNVVVSGVSPFIKTPFEIISRRSLFPDVFQPKTIRDRGLAIAQGLGLENEYISVTGLPSRGYQSSLSNLLVYKADPAQSAYSDIFEEKNRFLNKIGKGGKGFWITPRGNAVYNFKLALRYKDKEAAQKYLIEYINLGGNDRGLAQSLSSLSPLSGLSEKEQIAFVSSLDAEGKEKLRKATIFYQETFSPR